MLHLLGGGGRYLHKLFGVILRGKFVFSPIFIYSFNLFILVWLDGYLFYTLGYNPIILHLVAQIVLALVIASSFSWSCVPLIYPHHLFIFVCISITLGGGSKKILL